MADPAHHPGYRDGLFWLVLGPGAVTYVLSAVLFVGLTLAVLLDLWEPPKR